MISRRSTSHALTRDDAGRLVGVAAPARPAPQKSMFSVLRFFQRGIAMVVVMFALAMSVSYVIPNAQAFEPDAAVIEAQRAGETQVADAVAGSITAATVTRDAFGATAAPPPPPPPPPPTRVAVSIALTPSSSSASLQYPVAPGTKVLSPFGPRSCAGCSSDHQGVDLGAPGGSTVWAIADGVVVETSAPGYASLGTHVRIQHVIDGEMVTSVYAHMVAGSMPFSVGDTVVAGQALGAVGCTGSCTGNHLHVEIRPGGGSAVDPMAWLAAKVG